MPVESNAVRLYMQNKVVIGSINFPFPGSRLLDILGGTTSMVTEECGGFVELTNVSLELESRGGKKTPSAYFSITSIQLAATSSADTGRGMLAKTHQESYPFIKKSPHFVEIKTSHYNITGNIHLRPYQLPLELLEEGPAFLPLTDSEISSIVSETKWKVPFVAVNKMHIQSMHNLSEPFPKLKSTSSTI